MYLLFCSWASLVILSRAGSLPPPSLDLSFEHPDASFGHRFFASPLSRRANVCGNSTGISCPAGQCCGIDGYCGTGYPACRAPDCQFQYGPACDANTVPNGANTASVPRPLLGSVQYGGVTITNCVKPGTVAMTYDDGPGIYTSELLDMLAKANAKATFFITGNNNGKGEIDSASTPWPAVIKRMYHEGHQVASHTWSHANLDSLSTSQRINEMVKNEIAFTNILGFFPTYMRPPYTYCAANTGCTQDIANLGYHIVDFVIDTQDWQNQTPELIQNSKNIVAGAFANANAQSQEYLAYAHDIHEQTVIALTPFIISTVQSKGFQMVTVGECLGDPVENWYRNPSTGAAVTRVPALAAQANGGATAAAATTSSTQIAASSASPPTTSSSPSTSSPLTTSLPSTTSSPTTTVLTTSPSTTPTSSSTVPPKPSVLTSSTGSPSSSHTSTTTTRSTSISTTSSTHTTTSSSASSNANSGSTSSAAVSSTSTPTRPNHGNQNDPMNAFVFGLTALLVLA